MLALARRLSSSLLAIIAVTLGVAGLPGVAMAVSSDLVISQVYGGGGNTGATYTNDFIELFNRGTASVSLAGFSVQYASATGTGNFAASSSQITELTGTLAPGQYLLIQEAQGSGGTTPLPTPDVTDATPIAMSATGGKVALASTTSSLGCNGGSTPCSASALAQIIDLIGYDGANFFEGASPAPALTNSTAAFRAAAGCQDTDNNGADFSAAAPTPRNSASPLNACGSDLPPSVTATVPSNGASGVALGSDIDVTFSEAVNVSGSWFDITCATSGSHTATVSGGPSSFNLDPDTDFTNGETCTVTILAAQVTDQDSDDPPDNMAGNHVLTFQTVLTITAIHDIQGAAHLSAYDGTAVRTSGIVTAERNNGFWMQDPSPDADPATSEALFVFTSSAPTVDPGDAVEVSGTVDEFRPGGAASGNLTITEIVSPSVVIASSGNPLPAPTVIGAGGRTPPTAVIEDDAAGDVETSGVFDPETDGIDFYESLEAMLLQVNDAVASGPTNAFGEISVLADDGAAAGLRTGRGGIIIQPADFNPERIIVDDVLADTPDVNAGDHFASDVVGVLDYSFGNFKLYTTSPLAGVDEGLAREVAAAPTARQLSVATLNVENLDPGDGAKFADLADLIVDNLRSPDLLTLEEVQDNNGPTNDGVVAANTTLDMLVAAVTSAGGPAYEWRQIDPADDQDGGEPGGNIRVGFLFRTDRGLSFVDRAGGNATTAVSVLSGADGPELSISPGRIDPTNAAFDDSRKPLAGEFTWNGRPLFVVANHWNSKGGDQPLFGQFQPPTLFSEPQRIQQAQAVNDFVDSVLAVDPSANVIVAGDLNDFAFSAPLATLATGGVLNQLSDTLPAAERYSYVFDGNSQQLDHILVSDNLLSSLSAFDFVHVNAEFHDQVSDHDPAYALFGMASLTCDIVGTNEADVIYGTAGPDHICGLGGGDTIHAGSGDDIVEGGNGDDVLLGEAGNDLLVGGKGADSLVGGPGWDVMQGGQGADVLDALDGFANDVVDGGPGTDDCSSADPGDELVNC